MTRIVPLALGAGSRPATLESARANCDRRCCSAPARWALSYPDGRMRVCGSCVHGAGPVAEPLDADDELASDPRGFVERNGLI